jgi:hypothetical protein
MVGAFVGLEGVVEPADQVPQAADDAPPHFAEHGPEREEGFLDGDYALYKPNAPGACAGDQEDRV